MAVSNTQAIARRLAHEVPNVDESLPVWARRSNPIIRRQLGAHWRVFPPQPRPLLKWFAFFSVFVLLTIPYPFLFLFILTMLLAVAMLVPGVAYVYVKALSNIVSDATHAVVGEFQNDTFTLLRTTPFSGREIVLSKITAAIWRRMSDLDLTMSMAAVMGAPPFMLFYLYLWPPEEQQGIAQLLTIASYGSFIVRLPLEMFMVSTLAAMIGAMTRLRSSAYSATLALVFFYFLLLNLARFVEMSWQMQLFVDAILPIILPIVISFGAFTLACRTVTQD